MVDTPVVSSMKLIRSSSSSSLWTEMGTIVMESEQAAIWVTIHSSRVSENIAMNLSSSAQKPSFLASTALDNYSTMASTSP